MQMAAQARPPCLLGLSCRPALATPPPDPSVYAYMKGYSPVDNVAPQVGSGRGGQAE
jgi:hypothetical protein